ncbi:Uncharacterised protein [Bordetella pertussis]|nr:Uncharacterised protein [Bordetella pertussis]CFM09832.1 Uncharacterised protein [Bordetella pertussis]CFN58505.1 Uncharacterised protein [Bordetella pertussis]CFN67442.1 Uncharacterised protein [Bordetella pertussis]CFO04490.1 Uncharacterised protein [Bordetella pertussis]
MAGAVALAALLPQAVHGRQHFLRGDRAVPGLRRFEADVAVAASRDGLPEVSQQAHAPAFDGFAQAQHGIELLAEPAPVGIVAGRLVDHAALLHHVLQAIGQPRRGRQPVAAGPAGFLVVAFDRLGQVDVRHETHVGLVDAHAEGDGGHHDDAILAQEARLVGGAHRRAQTGMVGQGVDAIGAQEVGGFLDAGARQAVHHARFAFVLAADEIQQLAPHFVLLDDAVADIGTVEAGHEMAGFVQGQALRDLAARGRGGGGRQRDARHLGPALVQHRQPEVFGPEIMPPLRDAVRLVDGEQGDAPALEQLQAAVGQQALRRHVEQVQLAGQECLLDLARHAPILGGIEKRGPHPQFGQGVDLVLHQGDQGGNHDTGAFAHQRGHLVAQRLAAAGRHQHQRVAAADDVLDDGLLVATEGFVTENARKHAQGARVRHG